MEMKTLNPANTTQKKDSERKRIPMSVPVQRLEVPDVPGYHLHWFLGTPERLQRAQEGGYEFVEEQETRVNAVGLGNESTRSGNTDMGSRVSVVSGQEIGKDGQPTRLVLMKIKQEWWEDDQKLQEKRTEQVIAALNAGSIGADKDARGDSQHRYVDRSRTQIPDFFKPKRPKPAVN
jgi:hypothetical protein